MRFRSYLVAFVILIFIFLIALISCLWFLFGKNLAVRNFQSRPSGLAWLPDYALKPILKPDEIKHIDLRTISLIGGRLIGTDIGFLSQKRLIKKSISLFISSTNLVNIWKMILIQASRNLRVELSRSVIGYLPIQQSALIVGMVFGGRSEISTDLSHFFEVTGMLHVLSASGYNVGLMVGLSQYWGRRFWGLKTAGLFSMIVLFLYVALAQATPSVVRAGIMACLQLLAQQWCLRSYQPLWLLLITGISMVAISPLYLGNLSFQLSILACSGILLWGWANNHTKLYEFSMAENIFRTDSLSSRVVTNKFFGYFKDSLIMTIAAQLFSWPLQIVTFHQLSLVSLIANPASLWLTPWLTTGGLGLILVSWWLRRFIFWKDIILPLLALPLNLLATVFIQLVSFFGHWEGGVLEFADPSPSWLLPAWWMITFGGLFIWKTRQRQRQRHWYVV